MNIEERLREIEQNLAQRDSVIASQHETIEILQAENAELKKLLFGQSRERLPREKMPPMSRALAHRQQEKDKNNPHKQAERRRESQNKRSETAMRKQELPTEDVYHDLLSCPECQSHQLEDLGSPERSQEIEFVAAHFVRKVHHRAKKKCASCQTLLTAPAPQRVVDGCLWGPGLHAHTVVSKCGDSMPIYRQAKRYQREGIPLHRSTLLRLFHRTAELLKPLSQRIIELICEQEHINADETPLMVQAPERCERGYMWTFLSEKLIGYVFSKSRSGQTPQQLLEKTEGTLQVDNYTGYNKVCTPEGRKRIGCMAHIRRKFFKALESAPALAEEALQHILGLYEVEYEAAEQKIWETDAHLTLRKTVLAERMDAFEKWMKDQQGQAPPKSPLGKALSYALTTWPNLQELKRNAKLRLDNNLAENALRIVALGRKNYLFVANEEGGENLAVLQTIVSTCMANDVNPEDYIADVLLRLDEVPASQIDTLLPMNWVQKNKNDNNSTNTKSD